MQLLTSSIGRKILMALTGLFLVMFVVIHMIGNTTIFGWIPGGINAYAHNLHAFPPRIWAFRTIMLAIVGVHIYFGIQLTVENRACRQRQYAVKTNRKANFAGENMIWTGMLLLIFIICHLLHFTVKAFPGMDLVVDAAGAVDVFAMIVAAFSNIFVAAIYAGAMAMLLLHLSHGIQSVFQTFGLSNDSCLPVIITSGACVALVLFLGYVSIPLAIVLTILK
jgi:succinate dehydrogenase / fumarate reductase cytochrome b subunit